MSRADANLTADGSKLLVSNMVSGFDIYDMETTAAVGTISNPAGNAVHAVPGLFAHGGNAIIGGSTKGEVHVWDTLTRKVHQVLPLKGRCDVLCISKLELMPPQHRTRFSPSPYVLCAAQ